MFPENSPEYRTLKRLSTPEKIQTYLERIPFNHERGGETCMSVKRTLRAKHAHCFEGALVASAALMLMGEKPLIVSLKVKSVDDDHLITLFRRNGLYGAISKTNHPVLRYRDPVYRSVRELVMSYFHEYFLYTTGEKTLLGYTKPINMKRFGMSWLTSDDDLWDIAETIYDMPITHIVPKTSRQYLRKATHFERRAMNTQES